MKQPTRTFTTRFRVRYAETDQMGVVYHANYLVWFEVGRVEMMRALGFAYKQLEADEGCVLPVVEVMCRYRSPARYDEELELETGLLLLRGSLLKFTYKLWRPDPDDKGAVLLADAMTTHIVVDRSLNKCTLPEAYAAVMLDLLE